MVEYIVGLICGFSLAYLFYFLREHHLSSNILNNTKAELKSLHLKIDKIIGFVTHK